MTYFSCFLGGGGGGGGEGGYRVIDPQYACMYIASCSGDRLR